jgi:hypothetical protein
MYWKAVMPLDPKRDRTAKHNCSLTAKELLSAYRRGERHFHYVRLDGANLAGMDLTGASFYGASLRAVDLERTRLTYVQLKSADLTGANLSRAAINATDLIGATFVDADLSEADLTGACMARADCRRADMTSTRFNNVTLANANFSGTRLTGARLSSAYFDDVDVSSFCDARSLEHLGPSHIDYRTVIRSYLHPNLRRFMTDCGVPEIFTTYMIDCAHASGDPLLRSLMQSTFISYGGPDEKFARRIYDALRAHKVPLFFFPETARVGERIDNEVFRRLQEHDRVLLLCSRDSLDRPGVISEIQETLDREARDGSATYLLPVMIDDYVLTGWRASHPELAERVGRRIIGDFRKTRRNKGAFDAAVARVVDVLKVKRVT